ncbi:MAG: SDR family oxidoreductase [Granulosicoccus sp.]|nr:SDR family oxidoreductase [Granulosicoccus sp.]
MQKTAVITGAARGIGRAIASRFLNDGYQIALLDIDETTLMNTAAELSSSSVLPVICDVANPQSVDTAIGEVVKAFGQINALVNNAGIATFKPFGETTHEEWSAILSTNLNGAFYCSQSCLPQLLASGDGSIVNITSISGLRGSTLRTAYGTSKAALAHLTVQMAAELGNQGVRVNAVAPGPVDTAMAKKVHSAAIREDYHKAIPLNRYGSEEEIANVVAFLCSSDSSYVNGQQIAVDGGFGSTGIGLSALRSEQ